MSSELLKSKKERLATEDTDVVLSVVEGEHREEIKN